jgi:hypothetical protein
MKATKIYSSLLAIVLLLCLLAGCCTAQPSDPTIPDQSTFSHESPSEATTEIPSTMPVAEPEHSALYIPGVSVEDVILYFNEVCLDGEFINSGNASYVQKWTAPIYYSLEGNYTDSDLTVLNTFGDWLNSVEGFPGFFPTDSLAMTNLNIHFCSQQDIVMLLGPNFENMDGGVTFWYDFNEIYDAIICCRSDIHQYLRNSVLLEEIYNGLGPVQDTTLRPDSIIYQEFSQPQSLTAVDELIIRLLYHPDILPGMDASQCEQVIRSLYY